MRLTILGSSPSWPNPRRGLVGLPRRHRRRQPAAGLRQRRARAAAGARATPARPRSCSATSTPTTSATCGRSCSASPTGRSTGRRRPRCTPRPAAAWCWPRCWTRSASRWRDLERAVARARVPHHGAARRRRRDAAVLAHAPLRALVRDAHRATADRALVYTGDAALTSDAASSTRAMPTCCWPRPPTRCRPEPRRHAHDGAAGGGHGARRRRRPAGADAPRGRGPGGVRWPPRRPSSRPPTWRCRARPSTSERAPYQRRTGR